MDKHEYSKRTWTIETGSRPALFTVYDEDGNPVALDKTKEVACLVAAAPELLEALRALALTAPTDTITSAWDGQSWTVAINVTVEDIMKARAAITKTQGESNE